MTLAVPSGPVGEIIRSGLATPTCLPTGVGRSPLTGMITDPPGRFVLLIITGTTTFGLLRLRRAVAGPSVRLHPLLAEASVLLLAEASAVRPAGEARSVAHQEVAFLPAGARAHAPLAGIGREVVVPNHEIR
jgi:hypothetical protein